MTLSCSGLLTGQQVKVQRLFGVVVRATDSPDTVVRGCGFAASTGSLVGPGEVEQTSRLPNL
jgi:hypothetical protein